MRNSSAKVSLFHSPKGPGTERYISQAAKLKDKIEQRGMAIFSPSVQGTVQEIGGRCVNATFFIADNEILKVFVKLNPGYGRIEKIANFFIRPREHAAYRVLKINTIDAASVSFKTAKIEGCFDMLTLDEALAEGVSVKREFRRVYDPSIVASVISSNEILQPERQSSVKKEVVELVNPTTGESVNVVKLKRRRAISI